MTLTSLACRNGTFGDGVLEQDCELKGIASIVLERYAARAFEYPAAEGACCSLATKVKGEPAAFRAAAKAAVVVEAALVRPAVIVHDCLAQVKAVAQRRAAYSSHLRVDGFQLGIVVPLRSHPDRYQI